MSVCRERKIDGTYCQKACAEGDTKCGFHHKIAHRREQERRYQQLWDSAIDLLWRGPPETVDVLTAGVTDAFNHGWIESRTHDLLILHLRQQWVNYWRLLDIEPVETGLQQLAVDNHTQEVKRQTSNAADYLLKISVPEDQDPCA